MTQNDTPQGPLSFQDSMAVEISIVFLQLPETAEKTSLLLNPNSSPGRCLALKACFLHSVKCT